MKALSLGLKRINFARVLIEICMQKSAGKADLQIIYLFLASSILFFLLKFLLNCC
jgi:hypothetical protein